MTNEPLVLNEVPEPTPGPGEVVLDIKAAGLCHSDVGAMTDPGWLAIIPNRPITIGHELIGSGDLTPVVTVITFDEIPEGIENLHQGKVVGRLVAHIAA
jgi:D-arabinose 1-dehydrogenase-like Zn-dependent alcohol dehydrogenase